jgi:hypothetical protein
VGLAQQEGLRIDLRLGAGLILRQDGFLVVCLAKITPALYPIDSTVDRFFACEALQGQQDAIAEVSYCQSAEGKIERRRRPPMDAKSAARERFGSSCEELIELSHRIHANPELGFEEEKASSWLCESLDDAGFTVEQGICDLPISFRARSGSGPLHIGICAEYDCLPGIGHACGHNIIAASAVGAALAAAKVADDLGLPVSVIGTPAEEVGNASGKILLLERGAFQGIHAAMMVHPGAL